MKHLLLILLALTQVISALPKTQVLEFYEQGCKVELTPFVAALPRTGFYPLEVDYKNSGNRDQTIQIKFESTSGGRFSPGQYKSITYQLQCPANARKNFSLLIPVAKAQGYSDNLDNTIEVEANLGSEFNYAYFNDSQSTNHENIIFSSEVKTGSSAHAAHRQFKIGTLPTSLKAIRGYSVIVLTKSDWNLLSKAQKNNLRAWIKQGGCLTFIYRSEKQEYSDDFLNTVLESRGLGEIKLFEEGILQQNLNPPVPTHGLIRPYPGTFSFPDLLNKGFDRNWPLAEKLGRKIFGVGLLSVFILAFVTLIGPLNFFVFARQGKRHKLFITTPIISLISSLVLVLFIVLSDGFGGKGHQILHIELNPEQKHAYVYQEQFVRNGVLFSGAFELLEDYEFYQVPIPSSRWARVMNNRQSALESYTLSHTESGKIKYNGNYFSSRSEHGHIIHGHKVTQEDIMVEESANGLTVTSNFATPINEVFLRTKNHYFKVENLISGVPQQATKYSRESYEIAYQEYRNSFSENYKVAIQGLTQREYSFIAKTDTIEGIPSLKSIDWTCETYITGTFNPTTSR